LTKLERNLFPRWKEPWGSTTVCTSRLSLCISA